MKNLKLFVVILTMLVTSSFISSADGCFEDDGCGPWQQGGTDNIVLQEYAPCTIQVQWEYRICGNKKQIRFTAMGLTDVENGDCEELINYLLPNGLQGYPIPERLAEIYAKVYDVFVLNYFQSDYDWAVNFPFLDNPNDYRCPNQKIYEHAYPAKCAAWCWGHKVWYNPTCSCYEYIFRWALNDCESVACCIQRYTMCKDENGNTVSTREFIDGGLGCSEGEPTSDKCSGWEAEGFSVTNLDCGEDIEECVDPME